LTIQKFIALLRGAHFLPTLTVTTLSFALAWRTSSTQTAIGIAITVFSGQLIVGWSNDLIDYSNDLENNRMNKPLVAGHISTRDIKIALTVDSFMLLILTIVGPLSGRSGLLHLIAILSAVLYNYKLKSTLFSFLPYLISFSLLPIFILSATNHSIDLWVPAIGALFGIGAHFANVFKDLEADRASGVLGLPQALGAKYSRFVCAISFGGGAFLLFQMSDQKLALVIVLVALVFLTPLPIKSIFPLAMLMGLAIMTALILSLT
jgi:4-hydroxybenzoate polyprenyltransferase